VMRVVPPACFSDVEAIEVRRVGKNSITDLHIFRRPLPRNGGHDIFLECPGCRAAVGCGVLCTAGRRAARLRAVRTLRNGSAVSALDCDMPRRAVHFWSDLVVS
jgi:hypothetical protein